MVSWVYRKVYILARHFCALNCSDEGAGQKWKEENLGNYFFWATFNKRRRKTKDKAVLVDRVPILLPLKQKHPHHEENDITSAFQLRCWVVGKVDSQIEHPISPPWSGKPIGISCYLSSFQHIIFGPLFLFYIFYNCSILSLSMHQL